MFDVFCGPKIDHEIMNHVVGPLQMWDPRPPLTGGLVGLVVDMHPESRKWFITHTAHTYLGIPSGKLT